MQEPLYSITDLQAVDFALSDVVAKCYEAMNPENGPQAWRRFLERPRDEKIFYAKNDDIQAALRKVARLENEPERTPPDLPIILYYRQHGLAADMGNKVQVVEVTRFCEEDTQMRRDPAMKVTALPVTLTYSLVFLAWDRATIERMAIAWHARVAPLGRKYSRFEVPYEIDGERFTVGASINAPREILTSSEDIGGENGPRLWGSRTMCEVNTQAIYGAKVEIPDYVGLIGHFELTP